MIMSYDDMQQLPQLKSTDNDIRFLYDYQPVNIDLYLNLEQPSQSEDEHNNLDFHQEKQTPETKQNIVVNKVYKYWQNDQQLINLDDPKQVYLQESRNDKLLRYLRKKAARVWKKKVKYFSRQKVANSRQRVGGKFTSISKSKQIIQLFSKQQPVSSPSSPPLSGLKNQVTEWPQP